MTDSTTMLEQAEGGIVAEVAAAHHSNEDTNAAAAETEQAEGRLVVEAAAAHYAATKEKAKITGDVPRSQNNK